MTDTTDHAAAWKAWADVPMRLRRAIAAGVYVCLGCKSNHDAVIEALGSKVDRGFGERFSEYCRDFAVAANLAGDELAKETDHAAVCDDCLETPHGLLRDAYYELACQGAEEHGLAEKIAAYLDGAWPDWRKGE